MIIYLNQNYGKILLIQNIYNKDKFTGFFEQYCIHNKVKTK